MRSPTRVAGVDGCRIGWVAVLEDRIHQRLTFRVCGSIRELLELTDLILVDVPIGLSDTGTRECDLVARRRLGTPRSSSVFSSPVREALEADEWSEASEINRRIAGKGLSKQTWGLAPKIREVDELLASSPRSREIVREMHPELSFQVLNDGAAMAVSKKKSAGKAERRRLLSNVFGAYLQQVERDLRSRYLKKQVADDDLYDAFVALWTARRVAGGAAECIPSEQQADGRGVPMRMWV